MWKDFSDRVDAGRIFVPRGRLGDITCRETVNLVMSFPVHCLDGQLEMSRVVSLITRPRALFILPLLFAGYSSAARVVILAMHPFGLSGGMEDC